MSVSAPAADPPATQASERRPAPRWARRLALAIALCVLPSALWRLSIVFTGPLCDPDLSTFKQDWPTSPLERPYLVVLSTTQICAGLLAFGLVQRWGEVAPSWMPFIGGKTLSPRAVVTAAGIGAGLLFFIEGYALLNSIFEFRTPPANASCVLPTEGLKVKLIEAGYAPMVLWPALLTVLTVHYWRRRTRPADA